MDNPVPVLGYAARCDDRMSNIKDIVYVRESRYEESVRNFNMGRYESVRNFI